MTSLLAARGIAIDGRLSPTDLDVARPSLIGLIGPNGSGKTSLLRALAGVEGDGGGVCVEGEAIASAPPARRGRLLAFLPATRDLVWPIRARDIIALGPAAPDPLRLADLAARLELDPLMERPANRLSTGERSRVLLARALAPEPRLLLLDEPLSNLDPYWVLRTLDILRETVDRTGGAAIASLHDLGQAGRFDRLLLMDQGRVVADGPPDGLLESETLGRAFRIERDGAGWRVRPPADRRSSP